MPPRPIRPRRTVQPPPGCATARARPSPPRRTLTGSAQPIAARAHPPPPASSSPPPRTHHRFGTSTAATAHPLPPRRIVAAGTIIAPHHAPTTPSAHSHRASAHPSSRPRPLPRRIHRVAGGTAAKPGHHPGPPGPDGPPPAGPAPRPTPEQPRIREECSPDHYHYEFDNGVCHYDYDYHWRDRHEHIDRRGDCAGIPLPQTAPPDPTVGWPWPPPQR
jgi:hypothetical protein